MHASLYGSLCVTNLAHTGPFVCCFGAKAMSACPTYESLVKSLCGDSGADDATLLAQVRQQAPSSTQQAYKHVAVQKHPHPRIAIVAPTPPHCFV